MAINMLALLSLYSLEFIPSTEAPARTDARYLMRAGDAVFGNDILVSRSIQTLFHQQALGALNMFVPGMQIMPGFYSPGIL